jgi:hypothetical protein
MIFPPISKKISPSCIRIYGGLPRQLLFLKRISPEKIATRSSNKFKAKVEKSKLKNKKECLDFSQLSSTLTGLNYLRIYFSLKVFVDL